MTIIRTEPVTPMRQDVVHGDYIYLAEQTGHLLTSARACVESGLVAPEFRVEVMVDATKA